MAEAAAIDPRHANTNGRVAQSRDVKCPVCAASDRADKVSNVVRRGRGKLVFQNGEIAFYETELSELLDAPARPQEITIRQALLSGLVPLLVLAALFVVVAFIRSQAYVSVSAEAADAALKIGVGWFGVLMPGVLILRYAESRRSLERGLPAWATARRRWTALYYCSRDDVVFSPMLTNFASPSAARHLIYAGTELVPEAGNDDPAGPVSLRSAQ